MINHSKEELKEKRKLLPRMTAEQKKELLAFLDGDETSVKIGKEMIKAYLEIYPKELHFKKKFLNKIKSKEFIRFNFKLYSKYWSNIPEFSSLTDSQIEKEYLKK